MNPIKDDNDIRKKERSAIRFCCMNYQNFQKLDLILQYKLINMIESSILDASIDKARERNIPVYWNSDNFIEQYSSIGYNVKMNIDINSSVNKNKSDKIRYYLISKLSNFIHVLYLTQKLKNSSLIKTKLLKKIISFIPYINPKSIGYMNFIELNPLINQIYIDEIGLREQQTVKIKYSKMYTCNQCGNKKTQVREIQTRGGDEGGTLFINCIICGSIWRIY